MSKYEDYSEVSKVYDKERTAMGADTIVGLLHVHGAKPLKVSKPQRISSTDDFHRFTLLVNNTTSNKS